MLDEEYCYEIPRSWVFSTWGKVSEWITYGFTKPMPKASEGVKLLTAKDVVRFSVDIGSAGFTSEVAYSGLSDKDRPKKGDLLITKDGSIGRAALVRVDNPFCINQSVAVCWLRSTRMNKDYLEIVANADFTQRFVQDKAQGMAIQHLSIIDFAKCPLPVPPLEEQNEIVLRVDQLFAYADTIETQVNNALERVNNLTQSILAKAFRGELTEQWRKDNPDLISGENSAEALLEKIKAERAAAKPVKRGRRKA
jgi:type I restriction enzyme S subunit